MTSSCFVTFLDRALAPSVTLTSEDKTVAIALSGRECVGDLARHAVALGFGRALESANRYSENNCWAGMHGDMAVAGVIDDGDHYEDERALCIRIKKTFKYGSVIKYNEAHRKQQEWVKKCEEEARWRPRMGHVGAKAAELDREFGR
jgi:hypothetical protein